jgi:hypothetical protein
MDGGGNTPGGSFGGDASILMDYSNFSGSGLGVDLQVLVPVANFGSANAGDFVYLYSKFGVTDGACQVKNNADSACMTPDGAGGSKPVALAGSNAPVGLLDYGVDAGFEEWSARKKVPLPATPLLLGLALVGMAFTRRAGGRKAR